jgi:hypothetical protein
VKYALIQLPKAVSGTQRTQSAGLRTTRMFRPEDLHDTHVRADVSLEALVGAGAGMCGVGEGEEGVRGRKFAPLLLVSSLWVILVKASPFGV